MLDFNSYSLPPPSPTHANTYTYTHTHTHIHTHTHTQHTHTHMHTHMHTHTPHTHTHMHTHTTGFPYKYMHKFSNNYTLYICLQKYSTHFIFISTQLSAIMLHALAAEVYAVTYLHCVATTQLQSHTTPAQVQRYNMLSGVASSSCDL